MIRCPECKGLKKVEGAGMMRHPCHVCDQTGWVKEVKKEEVKKERQSTTAKSQVDSINS